MYALMALLTVGCMALLSYAFVSESASRRRRAGGIDGRGWTGCVRDGCVCSWLMWSGWHGVVDVCHTYVRVYKRGSKG
jgi:hypothetical protein